MSDKNDFLRTGENSFRLTADVLALMMKGGAYALGFCLVVGLGYWVLIGISNVLPAESKEQWDPTPESHLMTAPETVHTV